MTLRMTETTCLRVTLIPSLCLCVCVCACSEPEVQEHLRNVYTVTALAILSAAAGAYFPIFENIRLVSLIKSVCIKQKSQPLIFGFCLHLSVTYSFIDRPHSIHCRWQLTIQFAAHLSCTYLLFHMSKLLYLEQCNFSNLRLFIDLLNTDSLMHCFSVTFQVFLQHYISGE